MIRIPTEQLDIARWPIGHHCTLDVVTMLNQLSPKISMTVTSYVKGIRTLGVRSFIRSTSRPASLNCFQYTWGNIAVVCLAIGSIRQQGVLKGGALYIFVCGKCQFKKCNDVSHYNGDVPQCQSGSRRKLCFPSGQLCVDILENRREVIVIEVP